MGVYTWLVGCIALMVVAGCDGDGRDQQTNAPAKEQPAEPPPLSEYSRPLMGTVFRISIEGAPPQADHAVRAAFEEIERLEGVLSEWRKGSEISDINRFAGRKSVKVGEDVERVVLAGLDVSRWSRGAFDLSWAALWGLYNFRSKTPQLPSRAEVRRRLPLINWERIQVDTRAHTVFLKRRGMMIGTGGIAKGYALDRAAAILRAKGIDNYMIFGGGQVQVHGARNGRAWRVGIQHPRDPSSYLGALESRDGSFSTSGDYENAFIDRKGKRWHHIIDPETGRPATRSMSVTVLASDGIYADALSTAAFVMGPRDALRMFSSLSIKAEAVIIGSDCKLYATPGAMENLRLEGNLKPPSEREGEPIPRCTP